MSRFLKLTNMVINTSRISSIYVNKESVPKKIIINLVQEDFSGLLLAGSGFISGNNNNIKLCEQDSPLDFIIVNNWIDKLE